MRASAERLCVAWAKANTAIGAVAADRIATRFPDSPTLPFVRVFKVGGAPDASNARDIELLQWDIRATTPESADTVERTLRAEFAPPFARYNLAGVGYLDGITVSSSRILYGDIKEWFGYSIDTFVTVKEET